MASRAALMASRSAAGGGDGLPEGGEADGGGDGRALGGGDGGSPAMSYRGWRAFASRAVWSPCSKIESSSSSCRGVRHERK